MTLRDTLSKLKTAEQQQQKQHLQESLSSLASVSLPRLPPARAMPDGSVIAIDRSGGGAHDKLRRDASSLRREKGSTSKGLVRDLVREGRLTSSKNDAPLVGVALASGGGGGGGSFSPPTSSLLLSASTSGSFLNHGDPSTTRLASSRSMPDLPPPGALPSASRRLRVQPSKLFFFGKCIFKLIIWERINN